MEKRQTSPEVVFTEIFAEALITEEFNTSDYKYLSSRNQMLKFKLPLIIKDLMYTRVLYSVNDESQTIVFNTKKSNRVPFNSSVMFSKHIL